MAPYKEMYLQLYNAVTEALRCMDKDQMADAKTLLKLAQIRGEDAYVTAQESHPVDNAGQ